MRELLDRQRRYFLSGATLPVKNRVAALKRLKTVIAAHERDICAALKSDLGKSAYEAYMCEVGTTLSELSYMIKRTARFARDKAVPTPIASYPAASYVKKSPYGCVLIISPWNYPFMLSMEPLIDAVAAGNTAIIKPSSYSPATSKIVDDIIKEAFHPEYVTVVQGGREENRRLFDLSFDKIFFTGSTSVGKEVLRHAAERLTPVTLELGGKSPCIVDRSADIPLAARRIVFGKFLNCGQTCVAPDYVLAHADIKDKLLEEIRKQIKLQYGEHPLDNANYGRIISRKHYERVCALIDSEKVYCGGERSENDLKIAPTVMDNVSRSDAVMREEIFGPVLPVLTYENESDLINELNEQPLPLAFYVFSGTKEFIKEITERCRFGGGCINDTIMHIATSQMGFGGVGESGMGSYHGKEGFDCFTHKKSIVNRKTFMDLPVRYQPYTKTKEKFMRKFLK